MRSYVVLCSFKKNIKCSIYAYRDFSRRGQRGHFAPPENGFAPPENGFAPSELCLKWLNDKINFII